MDSGRFRRRTIALIAAYAVALQTLLTAVVTAVPAPGPFAELCSHESGNGTGLPASHDLPCAALCAAMGHGITGSLPAGIATAVAVLHAIAAIVPVSDWVPPQIALNDSHAPRGPPFA